MQNLNQIRARHVVQLAHHADAKKLRGPNGGTMIKDVSPILMNNGLLAALAYSMEKEAWRITFNWISAHLASPEVAKVPPECSNAEALLDHLVGPDASSVLLRDVTAEAGAWLDFARRLVK